MVAEASCYIRRQLLIAGVQSSILFTYIDPDKLCFDPDSEYLKVFGCRLMLFSPIHRLGHPEIDSCLLFIINCTGSKYL